MLRRAIANPARVGHCLYWSLAADAHIKGSAHRFELVKNTFLRHCGSYRTALGHQNFILQKLKQIQDKVKEMKATPEYSKKDELRKCVKEMNSVFPKGKGSVIYTSTVERLEETTANIFSTHNNN